MADFVGLAFANANRPAMEIAQNQQRQDQVLGQVLSVAGQQDRRREFNASMAQRAADSQEQSRQFDIVQNLRERQFALDQQQSMAQIAAIRSGQDLRALQTAQLTQQINEAPMRQAAMMDLTRQLSGAKTLQDLSQIRGNLSPEVYRFLPQEEIDQAVLNTGKLLENNQTSRLLQQRELETQSAFNKFLSLGGNPDSVLRDGRIDSNALYSQLGPMERTANISEAIAKEDIKTQGDVARYKFRIDQRKNEMAARFRNQSALAKYNSLMDLAAKSAGSFDPERALQYEQQANAVLMADEQGAVPAGPTIQTNPNSTNSVQNGTIIRNGAGQRMIYRNGTWQNLP